MHGYDDISEMKAIKKQALLKACFFIVTIYRIIEKISGILFVDYFTALKKRLSSKSFDSLFFNIINFIYSAWITIPHLVRLSGGS